MATVLKDRSNEDSDRGSTLVISAVISVVVFALAGVLLSFANREGSASSADRERQHAIDAAMAGAVVANSALTNNAAYTGTGLVSFAGGAAQFEAFVTPDPAVPGGFRRIITSYGYAPSKAAMRQQRTVRQVVELDPVTFTYGVFADGNYGDGSASSVNGGMYTGGSVLLGNSQDYVGDVAARGNIASGSNQKITGTLRANGNVSVTSSSTTVYGSVYAGGNIATGGTIRDTAQAGGTIGCAKVQGPCLQSSPPPLVPEQHLPTFAWNPANYVPIVPSYLTGAAFVAAVNKTSAHGVYYLTGSMTFSKQDSLRLNGDMTIVVANGDVALPGTITNDASAGVNVRLSIIAMSGNATAANNLTIPTTVTTLVYATGSFSAKNSSTFTGALYIGGDITMGAYSAITHAPITAPGFDWTHANPQRFTIRNVSTREVTGI